MTVDHNITIAAIATIISATVSATVSYLLYRKNARGGERSKIEDNLNQMISFYIQYPYLEDESFILDWTNNKDSKEAKDDKHLRYEAYCIYTFNFLDRICRFYKFKHKNVENHIHIKEIIRTHSSWWNNPTGEYDNIEGYSKDFRIFINSYLK